MFLFKKPEAVSWILVFLGNPGAKYAGTRHNAGFMTADTLAREKSLKIDRARFHALTAVTELGGKKVLLMKPQTFMNLSGNAVREAMNFYKVPVDHILVVSDDVALPAGKLRIRTHGSAGGHNGLKDIIAKCGGDTFVRVRIGVGSPPHPDYDMADWVLGTFHNADAVAMQDGCQKAVQALEAVLENGSDYAMCHFN